MRGRNVDWLAPWEATPPRDHCGPPIGVPRRWSARCGRQARQGALLPFVVTYDDRLVGQLTVGGITWGSLCSAHIGYWVDRAGRRPGRHADRGGAGDRPLLRRRRAAPLEVNIRPENAASLRVVEKLGFRDEGIRAAFLHIDGAWRDHRTFALTAEEVPGGLLRRWHAAVGATPDPRATRVTPVSRLILRHTGARCVNAAARRPTVLRVGSGVIYAASSS